MTQQMDSKLWNNRSQQTIRNVAIIIPAQNTRPSKPQFTSVSIQRVPLDSRPPQRYYEEYMVVDKEKEAQTGRWVLNVIAAHEAYKQALKANNNHSQSNKKKHSFQSRKSSKVEPIEQSPFYQTHPINQFPHHSMLSPTTIDDHRTTPMSSFSSATSIDDIRTLDRSASVISRTRTNSQLEDLNSTDEFKDSEEQPCVSKRIMITFTVLAVIFIIGIIVAVFITIFVGRNQSTSSSGKSIDARSLMIPLSKIDGLICSPTEMFNITDSLCNGEISYNYYSCYQMATSTSFTIQFALQHDTIYGHWYFDDISAVQNNNIQLIINGGFELNMTGWLLNISSDTYVDTTINLAHSGSAYLYSASKNSPAYIQQTFNVTQGEYINISFWWRYDGGIKLGSTCQAIGQLIPLL